MAPTYITQRLAELAREPGRTVLRRSLRRAHQRFREYAGTTVTLSPTADGHILAQYAPTDNGYQHEDEII